jgi:hypothetical protein
MPDPDAFNLVVADLVALQTKLSNGALGTNKITTAGVPLGVHPGLKDATTANRLSQEIRLLLERHLSASRLSAMAIGSHYPEGSFEFNLGIRIRFAKRLSS